MLSYYLLYLLYLLLLLRDMLVVGLARGDRADGGNAIPTLERFDLLVRVAVRREPPG